MLLTPPLLILLALHTSPIAGLSPVIPTAFSFPSFHNRPYLNLVGHARAESGGQLVIAGPGFSKSGAIWFSAPFNLSQGFFTEFTMTVSRVENSGHQGLAFVFQRDSPFALGRSGSDMGYAGLGEGVAVEFDTGRDLKTTSNHVAVQVALAGKLSSQHAEDDVAIGPLPDIERLHKPLLIRIACDAHGELLVHAAAAAATDTEQALVARAQLGPLPPNWLFYVGFTSATGSSSYAAFALENWRFGAAARQGCMPGFTGHGCSMTNDEAARWCSRRDTCSLCAQDVYNCMWCGRGRHGKCVVGTVAATEGCSWLVDESAACEQDEGLSLGWIWAVLGLLTLVAVFGMVLVRALPRPVAFKAVALLVALVGGGLGGMLVGLAVAACLVEVSASLGFAIIFAVFFLAEGTLVLSAARAHALTSTSSSPALMLAGTFILLASVWSLVLCKPLVPWLPEGLKLLLYTLLAAALVFCLVFSAVDLINDLWCWRRADYVRSAVRVARSRARLGVLLVGSLMAGLYFGLIFGLLRVEEEQQSSLRTALALRQDVNFTLPAGFVVGGFCGLLLQALEMPEEDQLKQTSATAVVVDL